jgi:stage IV sporulation protein A
MKHTAQDILNYVEDNDVKFVRLAFCDIFGNQKNISVFAGDLPYAFEQGVCFDGSSIAGFMNTEESDLVLWPDPDTMTILPWRPTEGRVIRELQEIGKPFLVLLNATEPESDRVQAMARDIASRYGVTCLPVNCLTLDDNAVGMILKAILYEFPLCELDLFIPPWVEALADDHPIKSGLYQAIRENTGSLHCIREVQGAISAIGGCESVSSARITSIQLGTGVAAAELQLPRALFYRTLSEQSGFDVKDDGDLLSLLTELSSVKAEYDKVAQAVSDARERGYGIVVPTVDELNLEEPEIMKQGGRYGVRLKASAPSLHIIRADIETTVSPIVGNEKQSEDMVNYLLQEFEGDTTKIWQSNIFGRSFHEIVNEDLQAKLKHMPDDARLKLRQTLERIINEGTGGLICIIL